MNTGLPEFYFHLTYKDYQGSKKHIATYFEPESPYFPCYYFFADIFFPYSLPFIFTVGQDLCKRFRQLEQISNWQMKTLSKLKS